MTRTTLLFALLSVGACRSATYSSAGVHVAVPAGGRCETTPAPRSGALLYGRLTKGDAERFRGVGCVGGGEALTLFDATILEGAHSQGARERFLGGFGPSTNVPLAAEPVVAPATLSTAPGEELRLRYEYIGDSRTVIRFVERDGTLYYATVNGTEAWMAGHEAEVAAWLDAVRFDDLAAGAP